MPSPLLSEYLQKIKEVITEIDYDKVHNKITGCENCIILDVRSEDNYKQEHLPGALCCDRGMLELCIEKLAPNCEQEIILYCGGGTRSALCAHSLQQMGYSNIKSMAGGFRHWKERGLPTET